MPDQEEVERDPAAGLAMIDVNVRSTMALLEAAAALLETRPGSFLCAFSSVAGDRGRRKNYAYGATKAALSAAMEGLSARLAPKGVTVLCVKPGPADSAMTWGLVPSSSPLLARPETVARDVLSALSEEPVRRLHPVVLAPDHGGPPGAPGHRLPEASDLMAGTAPAASASLSLLLFVGAIAVRVFGLTWDQGHNYHPDERRIVEAVHQLSFSPLQLDPKFYAYGSLPFYVTRAACSLLGNASPWFLSWDGILLTGRVLSALWGALGLRPPRAPRTAGSSASGRASSRASSSPIAVFHVQNSHFAHERRPARDARPRDLPPPRPRPRPRRPPGSFALAGVAAGLALATKASAATLLLPLGLAPLLLFLRTRRVSRAPRRRRRDRPRLRRGVPRRPALRDPRGAELPRRRRRAGADGPATRARSRTRTSTSAFRRSSTT